MILKRYFTCKSHIKFIPIFLVIIGFSILSRSICQETSDDKFFTKIVDLKNEVLKLYWKNNRGEIINTFANLKSHLALRNQRLVFAMNAGMYNSNFSPKGLYIEERKVIIPLDTTSLGHGNFYLQPNGVFYILANNIPKISKTENFKNSEDVSFATQSGPMLIVDGSINPSFTPNSANLNIRNGIGILPDNRIMLAISAVEVNFYEFALHFRKLGCRNALYLDGFISRIYWPEKDQTGQDGRFGALIGITKQIN